MTQSPWIGKTLSGRYEIQELLGEGGMSAVYKANDPNLRRVVAVKVIHPHLSRDPEFVRRFEEEAAAVAQLRHANLIQVYDFNHDEDTFYIVFEFVAGESIEDRLKRMRSVVRPMDIDEVVGIVSKTAEGLQYAHSKGLIHRDIKPANIMLNVTGDPIVMDFGIAKIMGGTQHTATGAVMGTARYMSPEQIKGERIDPRTDIYSLGVTLFEMLGGRPPFNADSAMTLMMMHMTDPVPNLKDLRADVPTNLVAAVNKSLAKDRKDRYQTAGEFAASLRDFDKGMAAAAGATMLESAMLKPAVDPNMTVLEPSVAEITGSHSTAVDTGAVVAAAAAGATGATTPPPPSPIAPPTAAGAAPPQQSGGSRTLLYAGGGIILLLLIAIGVWAIFFRGSGGDEVAGEVPPVTLEATETPNSQATIDAGVSAELETRAAEATQTAEAKPTNTPQPGATEAVEPTDVPEADSVGTVDQVEGDVVMITAGGAEIPVTANTPITEGSQFITGNDGQLTFTLEDESIVQLIENSDMSLDSMALDPADVNQLTEFTMFQGDLLLRQTVSSNELAVFAESGSLIAALQTIVAAAAAPKQEVAAKRAQQVDPADAAMSIHIEENVLGLISCFAGVCTASDGSLVRPGWERTINANGDYISSFPITFNSESYRRWQSACGNCLPPPSDDPATETPTATTGAPTATTAAPTATTATLATSTPTAAPTEETAAFAAQISSIALENGAYIVNYSTSGYTEQVPGRHVHFYFDTVSEANAGVPGSGPWKLYGGPRPFTQYTEADRGAASYMCIRVANPDHSIIFGSGNCFPLP